MEPLTIVIRAVCLIVGYLFGMIQSAYILGKAKGIDIREHGSGNAGTTNTLRVLGRKAGLIVFICDLLKMIVPVIFVTLIINTIFPDLNDMILLFKLYVGLGGILGHNFPFYLSFKGGKGIAATSGMIIAYNWMFIPVGLVVFFGVFFITHYVSLSSLILLASFFVEMLLLGIFKIGDFGLLPQNVFIEMMVINFIICAFGYIRHHENISRLIHHEERKTYLSHKN